MLEYGPSGTSKIAQILTNMVIPAVDEKVFKIPIPARIKLECLFVVDDKGLEYISSPLKTSTVQARLLQAIPATSHRTRPTVAFKLKDTLPTKVSCHALKFLELSFCQLRTVPCMVMDHHA